MATYCQLQKQLQGNGLPQVFNWEGPGFYGPVQEGSVVEMRFVCRYFVDSIQLESDKRAAGVMTVAFYETEPQPSAEELAAQRAVNQLLKLIDEYNQWLPYGHGNRRDPYVMEPWQISSAIVAEQWRRACLKKRY